MAICLSAVKMALQLMMLLLLLGSGVTSRLDTSVCTPPTNPPLGPVRPKIPQQFDVHMECNIRNNNSTYDVHEFFDYTNNRDLLRQYFGGQEAEVHYDYSINEVITILRQPNTPDQCAATSLAADQNMLLFGDKVVNGQHHMFSASGALHFNQNGVIEVYQNKDKVRGINVDKWYSCQHWPKLNATMNITWYFADGNNWDTSIGLKNAPVRCHVIGRVHDAPNIFHNFDHVYDLFNFRNYIPDAKDFETPRGLQCPGRKNTKPLPPVAPAMSFITETIDERQKLVSFMREQYDDDMKIVMFSMTPSMLTKGRFGGSRLDIVHDFNTGVQYIVDKMRGNCTVTPISRGMFDDLSLDAQHVRIRTAREFFYFNSAYSYEGVKNIRGVDCDTWVSQRTDYPLTLPQNSTWEWAFVINNWTSSFDANAKYKTPIPWQLTINIPGMALKQTINLYEFDSSEPRVFEFDITNCFANKRRRTFQFTFLASASKTITENKVAFRYALMKSILLFTSVSPLRISNLQTEIIQKIPTVTFDLLDVAPPEGRSSVLEPSINLAANRIISRVSRGQFVVTLQVSPLANPEFLVSSASSLRELIVKPTGTVTIKPSVIPVTPANPQRTTARPVTVRPGTAAPQHTPFSFPRPTYKSMLCQSKSGYSAGVMAGVSVAMILLGGVTGGGFAVMLARKRRRI